MATVVYNNYGVGEEEIKQLLAGIESLNQKVQQMADQFTNLLSKVQRIEDTADSAIVLINGLRDQLTAALNADTTEEEFVAEIQSITDRLEAQSNELAAAIATPGDKTVEEVEAEDAPTEDPPAPPVEADEAQTEVDTPIDGEAETENLGDNASDGSTEA